MSKSILYVFIIVIMLLLTQKTPVYAADQDIVINEVFPNPSGSTSEPNEFIELYNKGATPVDIANWQLSDTQGATKIYTIPSQMISPGGFVVFRRDITSIALNNTGDGVELKNSSGNLIDSMSFGNTSSYEDKSWSRVPDGTGGFVEGTTPTENSNNASAPPTSTPTPTSSPTNTPTPTKTPTATPTKVPTAALTLTLTPTKTNTPTSIKNATQNKENGEVLAEGTISAQQTPQPENAPPLAETPEVLTAGFFETNLSKILIALGGVFIVAAGVIFVKLRKDGYVK